MRLLKRRLGVRRRNDLVWQVCSGIFGKRRDVECVRVFAVGGVVHMEI